MNQKRPGMDRIDGGPTDVELVVAHYEEDLRWLRNVPPAVRVTVYAKGTGSGGGETLPNVGREAHTYLHHLVEQYDTPAEVTVFAQGKPFDHVPEFHKVLRRLVAGDLGTERFRWFGFVIDQDDPAGSRLFQRWGKNRDGRPLDLAQFWQALWGTRSPPVVTFYPGAHFAVRSEGIRSRPVAFYRRARDLAAGFPDAAHCFERCWDRVFGVDGIPAAHRAGPFPRYFRPIRRLGTTWADVR